MNDTAPADFTRIYAVREGIRMDLDGYREFIKSRYPGLHAHLCEATDLELLEQINSTLQSLGSEEGASGERSSTGT